MSLPSTVRVLIATQKYHLPCDECSGVVSDTTPHNITDDFAVALVVTVEIVADRLDDFTAAIEGNASFTRTEPGCLRFDVLRDNEQSNKFIFYEVRFFSFHPHGYPSFRCTRMRTLSRSTRRSLVTNSGRTSRPQVEFPPKQCPSARQPHTLPHFKAIGTPVSEKARCKPSQ